MHETLKLRMKPKHAFSSNRITSNLDFAENSGTLVLIIVAFANLTIQDFSAWLCYKVKKNTAILVYCQYLIDAC